MDIINAFVRQEIIIILTSNTIETTLCRLQEKPLSFVAPHPGEHHSQHRRQSSLRACRRSKIKQMNLRSRATTTTSPEWNPLGYCGRRAWKIKLALNAPQREGSTQMLCKLQTANLYPCVYFRLYSLLSANLIAVADNSVCRFTRGPRPRNYARPSLWNARVLTWCNKHETLGLVFRQRHGRGGGKSRREEEKRIWKWQTNNHTRRWKVCYVCCMSNQTPEHKTQANYSILRIWRVSNESHPPTQASMRPYLKPTSYDIMAQVNRHCINFCTGLQLAVDSAIPLPHSSHCESPNKCLYNARRGMDNKQANKHKQKQQQQWQRQKQWQLR